jgi:hypothetical protein
MLLLFRGGVDGSEIKNFFLMSVRESLIRKGQPAQNNEQNSHPKDRFHIECPWLNCTPPSLKQIDHEDGQGHEQENVDETSEGVGSNHAQKPKHTEHDENSPKHCRSNLTRNPCFERLCRA